MALARMVLPLLLLVTLSGFVPVGGCARGCGAACRSSSGVARSGIRGTDDIARQLSRTPTTRFGARPAVVPGVPGYVPGELGERALVASVDDAVAALPRAEGPASALARVPASNGKVLVAEPGVRSLADDYARSIDALGVTRQQHEQLLDLFDAAQAAIELGTAREDAADDPALRDLAERARLSQLAREIDARMQQVLEREQLQRLYAALGTPRVIAQRLARERPMQPAAP